MKVFVSIILVCLFPLITFASDFKVVFPLGSDQQSYKIQIEWSQVLPTAFKNGCSDFNYWDQSTWGRCSPAIKSSADSDAEAACETIGGRLPTAEEFRELIKYFNVIGGEAEICHRPNDPGYLKMQETFRAGDYAAGDQNFQSDVDLYLWTSTIIPNAEGQIPFYYTEVYHGFCGSLNGGTSRNSNFIGTRCVRSR